LVNGAKQGQGLKKASATGAKASGFYPEDPDKMPAFVLI